MKKSERISLDKFYTKRAIARDCWNKFSIFTTIENIDLVIEPSAGNGALYEQIKNINKIGFDLAPEKDEIIQNDFLEGDISSYTQGHNCAFFGNPPFGKKGDLAIAFVNKALDYCGLVGMILPNQFKKYSIQKQINKDAKLLFEFDLPRNSFVLGKEDYNVGCVFQVWSSRDFKGFSNLRIVNKPTTIHKDFEMYQYNATEQAAKYFDYDWDFAILRQGYGDFNEVFHKEDVDRLSRKKQWMFIKAKDEQVLNNLLKIDYNKLAELNTSVKGFGKADLVKEYNDRFELGDDF